MLTENYKYKKKTGINKNVQGGRGFPTSVSRACSYESINNVMVTVNSEKY